MRVGWGGEGCTGIAGEKGDPPSVNARIVRAGFHWGARSGGAWSDTAQISVLDTPGLGKTFLFLNNSGS